MREKKKKPPVQIGASLKKITDNEVIGQWAAFLGSEEEYKKINKSQEDFKKLWCTESVQFFAAVDTKDIKNKGNSLGFDDHLGLIVFTSKITIETRAFCDRNQAQAQGALGEVLTVYMKAGHKNIGKIVVTAAERAISESNCALLALSHAEDGSFQRILKGAGFEEVLTSENKTLLKKSNS